MWLQLDIINVMSKERTACFPALLCQGHIFVDLQIKEIAMYEVSAYNRA